jgi:hypothetical protein
MQTVLPWQVKVATIFAGARAAKFFSDHKEIIDEW